MRFTVISLGIIAAVMISSSHALGGYALDIAGKGKDGVGKVTDALDVKETAGTLPGPNEAKKIVDKATRVTSDAKGAVSDVKDGVSEARNGVPGAKTASSPSKDDIGNKARVNSVARRSFLVRKNLGHAVYKRRTTSDKLSQGNSNYKRDDDDEDEEDDDEDEDENNKNKSRKDHRDSITSRGSA